MNIANTPTKSWSLFDSSSFSNMWENNFEEIDFQDLNSSCSSYEIIDEFQSDCKIIEITHENKVIQSVPQEIRTEPIPKENRAVQSSDENPIIPESRPVKRETKDSFSQYIESTARRLLNSPEKQEEIKSFENLVKRFDQWLFEKREQKSLSDEETNKDPNIGDSDVSSCKFLVHSNSIDTFVLSFSDVYVNIVVKKQAHKNRIQNLFAKFLKETEPGSFIKEYNIDNQKNKSKIVFKFSKGTTKFIITAGLDFRLRLNQYIKLCAQIDERFISLGAFLSFWAYQRKIFSEKLLNPYALYFMLIYFLMTRNPPILPRFGEGDIQKMDFPKTMFSNSRKQGSLIASQEQAILVPSNHQEKIIKTDASINNAASSSLKDLLTQFFYAFAFEIPKLRKTLSVKTGTSLYSKSVQGYSVEDPFNSNYDLCKDLNNTKNKPFQLVKSEFERAYNMIYEGKTQDICQERKI